MRMLNCEPVVIPIPLRPDLTVCVHIPRDLTRSEAEKVARVVAALSVQR